MKTKTGLVSEDLIKGFINVTGFKGHVTRVGLEQVKSALKLLDTLKNMGFYEIEIGIENDMPLLLFLDEDRTTAFGIAPRVKRD
jgi:hypothetical protein